MRVGPVLGSDVSLEVFIAADDDTCKWDVHAYCQKIRSVKASDETFFSNYIFDALGRSKVFAKL